MQLLKLVNELREFNIRVVYFIDSQVSCVCEKRLNRFHAGA